MHRCSGYFLRTDMTVAVFYDAARRRVIGWFVIIIITSSSAIAEKPRCSVGQFWVAITPYSADRPISIKSNQIEIID